MPCVAAPPKRKRRAGKTGTAWGAEPREKLTAGRHLQLAADVLGDLGGIEVNEVSDPVIRDAAELRPFPQRANRRLLALRENSAEAQAHDVGEPVVRGGF